MKILLIAVGTRGDVEPFLAIAEMLTKKGEEVICCFPGQFKGITEENGFRFSGLTSKYLETLESDEGVIAMGGKANFFQKIRAYYFLYKRAGKINKIMSKQQKELIKKEEPDKVIYHVKASYPLIYETLFPNKTVLVSPIPYVIHPVKDHAHIGFKNMGEFLNKLTYRLANYGLLKNNQAATKGLYDKKEVSSKKILSALKNGKMVYSVSPNLFNPVNNWGENVKVFGYHERNKTLNWSPDENLVSFIKQNQNIVFITFGSMVNAEPKVKAEFIIRVLEKLKIPAIINSGYGGLAKPDDFHSDSIYFVSSIPYDWLLPQIDYMIHHGGSGTTHMAIKNGCASAIIPHIVDQFMWNKINFNKGFGPKGVSINRLNESNFETLLTDLISNPDYLEKVKLAANKMNQEDFESELCSFLLSK